MTLWNPVRKVEGPKITRVDIEFSQLDLLENPGEVTIIRYCAPRHLKKLFLFLHTDGTETKTLNSNLDN